MRLSLGRSTALLLLCGSSAACHYALDTRSLFAELTYPGGDAPRAPAMSFQLYSRLELEGVTSYDDPVKVAACYRKIDGPQLRELGTLMAERSPNDETWAGTVCMAGRDYLPKECQVANLGEDTPRALLALAHMGGAVRGFSRATETTNTGDQLVHAQAVEAIKKVAVILEATPPRRPMPPPGPHPMDRKLVQPGEEPVLVLSGGSANGAFTAGVLFELLWARERAMKKVLAGVPAEDQEWTRASIERGTRFSALVGTSVGSLISQLLDLYFVDPSTKPTAAQKELLERCIEKGVEPSKAEDLAKPSKAGQLGCFSGWPESTYPSFDPKLAPDRPFQMCALRKLVNSFVDIEESQLLCVQPGSITRAAGILGEPTTGLIRFDPMTSTIVDPILKGFGREISENETTRVVVS